MGSVLVSLSHPPSACRDCPPCRSDPAWPLKEPRHWPQKASPSALPAPPSARPPPTAAWKKSTRALRSACPGGCGLGSGGTGELGFVLHSLNFLNSTCLSCLLSPVVPAEPPQGTVSPSTLLSPVPLCPLSPGVLGHSTGLCPQVKSTVPLRSPGSAPYSSLSLKGAPGVPQCWVSLSVPCCRVHPAVRQCTLVCGLPAAPHGPVSPSAVLPPQCLVCPGAGGQDCPCRCLAVCPGSDAVGLRVPVPSVPWCWRARAASPGASPPGVSRCGLLCRGCECPLERPLPRCPRCAFSRGVPSDGGIPGDAPLPAVPRLSVPCRAPSAPLPPPRPPLPVPVAAGLQVPSSRGRAARPMGLGGRCGRSLPPPPPGAAAQRAPERPRGAGPAARL